MNHILERIFDFVLHYNLLTNIKKYSRGNILLKTIYLLCIQKPKKEKKYHNKFYFYCLSVNFDQAFWRQLIKYT